MSGLRREITELRAALESAVAQANARAEKLKQRHKVELDEVCKQRDAAATEANDCKAQ